VVVAGELRTELFRRTLIGDSRVRGQVANRMFSLHSHAQGKIESDAL